MTLKEARKLAKGETVEKPVRPEIANATQDYVDLHRHAAVRARLAAEPGAALRVAVAHMIVGSPLWTVKVEPQRAASDAVTESVENCASEAAFDAKRRAVLALLGFDPEAPTVTGGNGPGEGLSALFVKLLALDESHVLDILTIVMGETLDARSDIVDTLGIHLAVDMAPVWQADDAFLEPIRDREVLLAMVEEVAGKVVADANAGEKGKTLRTIISNHLAGADGRKKVEGWVPRWMRFPAASYTSRGGVGAVRRSERVAPLLASEPQPDPVREAA